MSNDIGRIILETYKRVTGRNTGASEISSWTNSLQFMERVLADESIPGDSGVAIEYHIPQSSKRIDFILTGLDKEERESVVLIELKQWQKAEMTNKDAIVTTRFQHGEKETAHPSYQAWSYKRLLEDYNETVEEEKIQLFPCAYLHNYEQDNVITNDFYKEYTDKAPVFLKSDALKLREFIKSHVKHGDKSKIMYRIDQGRIRPSKSLADELHSMLSGNDTFVMIDEQKVVFETALKLAQESSEKNKNVLIVPGGPGTGKSVLAINLLVALTGKKLVAQYITRNSAPREVYEAKLTGSMKKSHITNLFSGSGSFHKTNSNIYDALIVDEAHRLNAKSGMFSHLGENQVKEIISASKFSVFFVDEDQKVTLKDIGDKEEIKKYAKELGATVTELELESQFRCNGSNGYLAWLDNTFQIRDTANENLEDVDYDFQIFEDPQDLHDAITAKNKEKNKARVVAGYCWKWVSKRNSLLKDIQIGDYRATWNLNEHGQAWIIHPESVSEVGCIHTCQGLEVDYVGVIVGPDLIVRNGKVETVPKERASSDKSVHGWKTLMKTNPEAAKKRLDSIIKNTYRTLMTRGMKGCYVYFTDKETEEYFKSRMDAPQKKEKVHSLTKSPYMGEMVNIPLFDSVGCGDLMFADSTVQELIPVKTSLMSRGSKYFVLRTSGDSMNQAGINDGDLVLCRKDYHPEVGNRVVALIGDDATIKEFHREDDSVVLKPRSSNPRHQPLIFTDDDEIKIQGVVVGVLESEDF
jgi:SOS-response transcriptional repressor LexA